MDRSVRAISFSIACSMNSSTVAYASAAWRVALSSNALSIFTREPTLNSKALSLSHLAGFCLRRYHGPAGYSVERRTIQFRAIRRR